jgi:hypothetical protein
MHFGAGVPNKKLSQQVEGVPIQFHVTDIIRQCLFATSNYFQEIKAVPLWILEHIDTFLADVQSPS